MYKYVSLDIFSDALCVVSVKSLVSGHKPMMKGEKKTGLLF